MLAVIVGIRANAAEQDRARNLKLCLETLKAQDLSPAEFQTIVVEQDHAPGVAPAITALADRYQFAYNAGPYNRGWAFNIGAKLTTASHLLFLDADAMLRPDSLRRTLELLKNFSAVRLYREAMFLDRESTRKIESNWPQLPPEAELNGTVFVNPMGLCIAVEAALYNRIGGHDERFWGWGWEDREFWERLEQHVEVGRLPDRIYHLHHEQSQIKEVWAATNQALFFETLETKRTISIEPSKGDPEKYRPLDHTLADRYGVHEPQRPWFSCKQLSFTREPTEPKLTNQGPAISVVMPTYYRLHTLLDAVDSLIAQTYTNWELILVDNAGDSDYNFADTRIRVAADAGQRGAAYARNSGIKHATGQYVCFFDDDDVMYPHYLERLITGFEKHPEAEMIRCGMRKPDGWDNFSYATPSCCLRRNHATPTWVPEHGQDQTYFKTIAQNNGWTVENGKIVVLGEVLCAARFDLRGGLRRGDL